MAHQVFMKRLNRYDHETLKYLFTDRELENLFTVSQRRVLLAVSFAGKEAISKAIGTGMGDMLWTDFEVIPDQEGSGQIVLLGEARAVAKQQKITDWKLSWQAVFDYVYVIAQGN